MTTIEHPYYYRAIEAIPLFLSYLNLRQMDFFTPIKENLPPVKQVKTTTQSREGDWVCLNCNNLNFSFRKKCNRCKTQTRQQNDNDTNYSYYYYKPFLFPAQASHTTVSADSNPPLPLCTPKRSLEHTPEKKHKELPSVSPLVKKYNSRELDSSKQSKSSGSMWGVAVREFEQVGRGQQWQDQEDASLELEQMIGRIML